MEAHPSQLQPPVPSNTERDRLISENNKRAYELLMRIQSQLEASTVIATSFKRESA